MRLRLLRARLGLALACAGALAVSLALVGAAQAAPPQIVATWASDVNATTAKLNAGVNPNGLATTLRFEYITAAAYQANLDAVPPREGFDGAFKAPAGSPASIGSGATEQKYQLTVTSLKPNTAYRYRLLATNSDNTTTSPMHTFITEATAPVFALPDGRGWEMVSPVDKNGGAIQSFGANFGGGTLQAAAQGGSVTYSSSASFAPAQGAPGASQYISRRSPGAWSTENITVPLFSGSYSSAPQSGVPYQLFSTDLAAGLLTNGERCRSDEQDCMVVNPPLPGSGAPAGYRNYYLRDNTVGTFQALLTDTGIGELALPPEEFDLAIAGATPNLSQVLLSTCAALTPDATEVPGAEGCNPAAPNLYRWSGGALDLVNLLPGQSQGAPGAALAASSRAVSPDGSRVYWVSQSSGNLYLRDGEETVQVDGAPAVGGGGTFQTASADGSIAFFTKAGHLYRYDVAGETTTDLTPGGEVQGVLGASDDGAYLYYVTTAGLFLRHDAATTPIASAVAASSYPPSTGTARVSADGAHLVFLSSASLSEFDNNGAQEVYLYDVAGAGTLTCVSCNPTGERPLGPSSIPGATANGEAIQAYKPRILSANGARLYFDSFDSLAPQDTNNDRDVYQWQAQGSGSCQKQGGCINLISSGRSEDGASFVDASADGADVFFLTDGSLVPSDPGSVDVYDARIGGGFPVPPTPIPCLGDACQPLPGEPEDPTPGTLLVRGEGNPAVNFPKTSKQGGKKKHHKKKHHHKKHRNRRSSR